MPGSSRLSHGIESSHGCGPPISSENALPWLRNCSLPPNMLGTTTILRAGLPRYNNTAHFNLFGVGDVLLAWGERKRAEALWTSNVEERVEYSWTSILAQRNQLILACLDGRLEQAFDVGAALIHEAELLGAGPYGRENASMFVRRAEFVCRSSGRGTRRISP